MTDVSSQHLKYLRIALEEARRSPPKPTNYCVGALLVDEETDKVLATGYTLELEGNTHAEQCCFSKFATAHGVSEEQVGSVLPPQTVLYTTMEPCTFRLSENLPCAQRVLQAAKAGNLRKVYTGVREPSKFVKDNSAQAVLEEAGIAYIHVLGLEDEIIKVATAGHEK